MKTEQGAAANPLAATRYRLRPSFHPVHVHLRVQRLVGVAELGVRPMKLFFAFSALVITCVQVHATVLINPDYETGDKTGWTLDFNDQFPNQWKIVTSPVHTGSYALLADNFPKYISQTFEPVSTESILQLAFSTFTNISARIVAVLTYSDSTGTSVQLNSSSNVWQTWDVTSSLTQGKSLKRIAVDTYNANGDPYAVDTVYDSFILTTVPEPSILVLFFIGTTALIGRTMRCS